MLAATFRVWLQCVLLMAISGCGPSSPGHEASPQDQGAELRFRKNNDKLMIVVTEGGRIRLSEAVSTYPGATAIIEDVNIDFDGNGTPEYIVGVWEGQNSGDYCYIIGNRNDKWSIWLAFPRPGFKARYEYSDGKGTITTEPGKQGEKAKQWRFVDGRFQEVGDDTE